MKSLFLPAVLILAVACTRSTTTAKTSGGRTAEVGVVDTVYEVVNEMDRKRVGFVNKTSYDSGRIVYWVYGPDYRDKLGYIFANNRAFRYVWEPGNKRAGEQELIADTRNSSVRRILGNDVVVVLVPIDPNTIATGELKSRYAKPERKDSNEEGCGCGE